MYWQTVLKKPQNWEAGLRNFGASEGDASGEGGEGVTMMIMMTVKKNLEGDACENLAGHVGIRSNA